METKREKGARGEDRALKFLLEKGYTLLGRNVRIGRDELDLIMLDGACVVFVEVKARTGIAYGLPCEAVDARKQAHMTRAALAFLQKRGADTAARFDVAEVDLVTGAIRHIENAFMARA